MAVVHDGDRVAQVAERTYILGCALRVLCPVYDRDALWVHDRGAHRGAIREPVGPLREPRIGESNKRSGTGLSVS